MGLNLTVQGQVPADHFEAAEALLAVAQHEPQPEIRDRMLSAAQVHALLALGDRICEHMIAMVENHDTREH